MHWQEWIQCVQRVYLIVNTSAAVDKITKIVRRVYIHKYCALSVKRLYFAEHIILFLFISNQLLSNPELDTLNLQIERIQEQLKTVDDRIEELEGNINNANYIECKGI